MSGLSIHSLVRRVDLFTLKLFLTAIEEGQIGRAAAREHIAASAATKRIQDLEELAGLKLFDRNAKGVVPSQAGLVFAKHIRMMLDVLDAMRREISEFTEGVRGHVGVAAPRLLIVHFLAQDIGEFTRRFPMVDVEVREETNVNSLRALIAGDVDLAVFSASAEDSDPTIESWECRTDRLVAVVPIDHPLAKRASMTLDELLDQDIVGILPTTTVMANLRHFARQLNRELHVKYSVNTVEAARSLVGAGLGVALQPQSMLFFDERDRVATVPLEGHWAERSYRVGKQRGKVLGAAAEELIDQLTTAKPRDPPAAA